MIATTIEQSKRLLETGIDPQTADMCYIEEFITEGIGCVPYKRAWTEYPCVDTHEDHDSPDMVSFPAWSLSALIKLIYSIPTNQHRFEYIVWENEGNIEGIFEDCVTYLCKENKN